VHVDPFGKKKEKVAWLKVAQQHSNKVSEYRRLTSLHICAMHSADLGVCAVAEGMHIIP
jgi:hypothetical protein